MPRGGVRVGSGRPPARTKDDPPKDTTQEEMFSVIGSVVIPREHADRNGLRVLRDRLVPLLRQLGLTPMTKPRMSPSSTTGFLRNRYPHHRRVDASYVLAAIRDDPGKTTQELAKIIYCPNGMDWTDQDQRTALQKTRIHLVRLCADDYVERRYNEKGETILFPIGKKYLAPSPNVSDLR